MAACLLLIDSLNSSTRVAEFIYSNAAAASLDLLLKLHTNVLSELHDMKFYWFSLHGDTASSGFVFWSVASGKSESWSLRSLKRLWRVRFTLETRDWTT